MNLTPYLARGFGRDLDDAIANVGVAGIDREQAQSMVRLCEETEPVLYGDDFSPRRIRYRRGSSPTLETVADTLTKETPKSFACDAMRWVQRHVRHPHLCGEVRTDRALSEEQLIASGCGFCNEQARVFIALLGVREIPARLCFLFHKNGICGHTATEVLLNERWSFFDVTFNVCVPLPDGTFANAWQLSRSHRDLAHDAYRQPLQEYFAGAQEWVEKVPGWRSADRPAIDKGGDLLHRIGICNYVPQGCEAPPPAFA